MRYIREGLESEVYALNLQNHVWGMGPDTGEIKMVLVGEAPGEEEVAKGEPFVGPSGRLLSGVLSRHLIYRGSVWITNLLTVRPPNNDIQSPEAQEALEVELPYFWKELEYLVRERGARVIVGFGGAVARAFGLKEKISTVRGGVYEVDLNWQSVVSDPTAQPCDCVFIPTYHPSYLLQKGRFSDRGKGTADLILVFEEDIAKAKRIAERGYCRPTEHFNIHPTVEDVREFVREAIRRKALVAVDTETAFAERRVVMIGLALDGENALVVPFLQKGGSAYWTPQQETIVREELNNLFCTCPTLFQNAPFDLAVLLKNGFRYNWDLLTHDILLIHHTTHAELPHDLAFIASVYAEDYQYWKGTLAGSGRTQHILEINDEELRTYNARDTVVLHRILPELLKELEELEQKFPGASRVYYEESLKLVQPIVYMSLNGIGYDRKAHLEWKRVREEERDVLEKELKAEGGLPDYFDLRSELCLRYLLFGVVPEAWKKHVELEKTREGTKKRETLAHYRAILQSVKPFYLPPHISIRRTEKTRKEQLDKKARLHLLYGYVGRIQYLESLKRPTEEHLQEKAQLEKQIAWIEKYERYASLCTLLSTFVDFPNVKDGRLYPSYMIHGTVTGRLSSRQPNAQNMPKKDTEFRRIFVAPKGRVLLSADYSNLEVGTLAYESQDPLLIEIFETGQNLHDINTQVLFGIDASHPNWSLCRRAAKIDQFGTQYGGGEQEVYMNIVTEVPQLRLSFQEYKKLRQRKFEKFTVFAQWYRRTMEEGIKNRYTKTFLHRVRFLYGNVSDIGKEALNTPCQGAAAHIMNRAMIRLFHRLLREYPTAQLVLQVHDQLVYEVDAEDAPAVARIMKEEMEWPVLYYGRTVKFPVEIEIGKNLAQLEPLPL